MLVVDADVEVVLVPVEPDAPGVPVVLVVVMVVVMVSVPGVLLVVVDDVLLVSVVDEDEYDVPVVSVPVVTFVDSVFVQATAKIASAATMMTARVFFMLFIPFSW